MDKCFMAKKTSITLAYIHVPFVFESEIYATRFVETYIKYPPGIDHKAVAICNFGKPNTRVSKLFSEAGMSVMLRSNDGWDIGAYQELASKEDPDIIVCLGESVHFHRQGWLNRIVEAFSKFGEGMYGCLSSYGIRPHLQTTAFACSPRFLREYPVVHDKSSRYEFEHGIRPLWKIVEEQGFPVKLVTWDGEYDSPQWRHPKNILWRGDQSNCLLFCNHTDRYFSSEDRTKARWRMLADGLNNAAFKGAVLQ